MRQEVTLECSECKARNYRTSRDRQAKKKLELKKHCPKCRRHTVHKETRR